MNKLKIVSLAAFIALSLSVVSIPVTPANAVSETCSVKSTGTKNTTGASDSRFVVNNNSTVSATFEVKGDDSCRQTVTLATWTAPDAAKGRPYNLQKLHDHVTKTYGKGTYTLTATLPNCFYQVDLVRGDNQTSPNYAKSTMMGSLHGGVKTCEVSVTPRVTPTPTTTPSASVLSATSTTLPAALPSTGPTESFIVVTLLAALAAAGAQYLRQSRAKAAL